MNTNSMEEHGILAKRFTRTLWGKAIAVTIAVLYAYGVTSCVVPQKAHAMSLNSVPSNQLNADSGQAYKAPCAPGQVTTEANPCEQEKSWVKVLRVLVSATLAVAVIGMFLAAGAAAGSAGFGGWDFR